MSIYRKVNVASSRWRSGVVGEKQTSARRVTTANSRHLTFSRRNYKIFIISYIYRLHKMFALILYDGAFTPRSVAYHVLLGAVRTRHSHGRTSTSVGMVWKHRSGNKFSSGWAQYTRREDIVGSRLGPSRVTVRTGRERGRVVKDIIWSWSGLNAPLDPCHRINWCPAVCSVAITSTRGYAVY